MGRRRPVNSFQFPRRRLPAHLSALLALGAALAIAAYAFLFITLRLQEISRTSPQEGIQNNILPSRLRSLRADSNASIPYKPSLQRSPRLVTSKHATSSAIHSDTRQRGVDAAASNTFTPQSFKSCTHWSEDDASAFADRANHARAGPVLPHPIPRQLLLNYGLWSGFSLPVPPSAEGADLSAAPELIASLPLPLRESVSCWLETHPPPHWRVRLWDGPSAEAFMQHFHPQLLQSESGTDGPWRAYSRPVQRADLLRVLLVAAFGGLYIDLDVRPSAAGAAGHAGGKGPHPLDELWASQPTAAALLFEEAVLAPAQAAAAAAAHPIRGGAPEECQRIANYMLAAASASPPLVKPGQQQTSVGGSRGLLQGILDLMVRRALLPVRSDYDVLYTTGPAMLTEAVHAYAAGLAGDSVAATAAAATAAAGGGSASLGGLIAEAAVRASSCGPSASDLLAFAAVDGRAGEVNAGAGSSGTSLRRPSSGLGPESQLEAATVAGVVAIVRRPVDQLYFDHMTTGTWRGGVAAVSGY